MSLEQMRQGLRQLIDENRNDITIYRKPLVDNGFGKLVEDPAGAPTDHRVTCRISKEIRRSERYKMAPGGFATIGTWIITVDYEQEIYENDVFSDRGKEWRIGPVHDIRKFGGIVGYDAPLYEAGEASEDVT